MNKTNKILIGSFASLILLAGVTLGASTFGTDNSASTGTLLSAGLWNTVVTQISTNIDDIAGASTVDDIAWYRDSKYCVSATTCDNTCPVGQKLMGGGCNTDNLGALRENRPSSDSTWRCRNNTPLDIQTDIICGTF